MTDKTIQNTRIVGVDYFRLIYVRASKKYLNDYLLLFNFNDYYCFKSSEYQRQVSYEELLEFKYSGYIFFKKDKYNIKFIELWLKYIKEELIDGINYLSKPFPPFNPYEKITIKYK